MEITFVRHAQKEEIGEDPSLTKKGIKQANALAKRIKKEEFNEFYCSELTRAKQTAEIVSKHINIKPQIESSLNEFKSETIKKPKNKWNKEERSHYNKLVSFLKKITKSSNKKKTILIIAHGITNRIILSHFLSLNLRNMIQFTQKEAGVNSLYWNEKFKNWRLRFWNDNHHVSERLSLLDTKSI